MCDELYNIVMSFPTFYEQCNIEMTFPLIWSAVYHCNDIPPFLKSSVTLRWHSPIFDEQCNIDMTLNSPTFGEKCNIEMNFSYIWWAV